MKSFMKATDKADIQKILNTEFATRKEAGLAMRDSMFLLSSLAEESFCPWINSNCRSNCVCLKKPCLYTIPSCGDLPGWTEIHERKCIRKEATL